MEKQIKEALADLDRAASLSSRPHPMANLAKSGQTLRDYCLALLQFGSVQGKRKAFKIIQAAI